MSTFLDTARAEAEARWPDPGSPGYLDTPAWPEDVAESERDAGVELVEWALAQPPTQEELEAAAKALYLSHDWKYGPPWEHLGEQERELYRGDAKAALDAAAACRLGR